MNTILIEGADHLGKSTLAGKFTAMEHKHLTRDDVADGRFDFCEGYFSLLEEGVVWDRFHLGSLVYGWCLGLHEVPFDLPRRLGVVDRELQRRKVQLHVVYTSDEDWYERHLRENGKDELFSVKDIMQANRVFQAVAPPWACLVDVKDGRWPS